MDINQEFNFSEIRPTLEQKTWMAGLIMSKVETSSSLAKKYHYSRKRLNTIVSQIREGKVLHSHGGRPRVLDEESYKNCSDEILGDSEITKMILAEHINDEYHATLYASTIAFNKGGKLIIQYNFRPFVNFQDDFKNMKYDKKCPKFEF